VELAEQKPTLANDGKKTLDPRVNSGVYHRFMTLFLFLLFIFTAVFGRMILQYRMTGDYGIRFAGKSSPPVQIAASLLLSASGLLILFYTLGLTVGYLTLSFQPGAVQMAIGYLLYFSGLSIVLVSQHQMGCTWRVGVDLNEETKLITTGLFKYVRNPIYTGLFIGCIGLWCISPSIILILGLLILYISVELFVRKVEEPYLHEQFGSEYEKWHHSTPRYFPRLIKAND
jgi:protein-S-isoprenylcysteine O-methyltransferase Ste14